MSEKNFSPADMAALGGGNRRPATPWEPSAEVREEMAQTWAERDTEQAQLKDAMAERAICDANDMWSHHEIDEAAAKAANALEAGEYYDRFGITINHPGDHLQADWDLQRFNHSWRARKAGADIEILPERVTEAACEGRRRTNQVVAVRNLYNLIDVELEHRKSKGFEFSPYVFDTYERCFDDVKPGDLVRFGYKFAVATALIMTNYYEQHNDD